MYEEFDIRPLTLQRRIFNLNRLWRYIKHTLAFDLRTILCVPICLIVILLFIIEGLLYILVRFTGRAAEKWLGRLKTRSLISRMRTCKKYQEYAKSAKLLDNLTNRTKWKRSDEMLSGSSAFDPVLIRCRINELRLHRRRNDLLNLYKCVKSCLETKLLHTLSLELWSHTYHGTKKLSEVLHDELLTSIMFLERESCNISDHKFLHNISNLFKIYGSTCIVFSGGAMLGLHHLGVLEVLLEMDRVPTIVAGTSAGAVVAAFTCTRNNHEILLFLKNKQSMELFRRPFYPDNIFMRLLNFFRYGYTIDIRAWYHLVDKIFGKITFLEAYEKTGRVLNISVTRAGSVNESVLLNYRNASHVLVSTAVLASSSFPYLGCPIHLLEKDPLSNVIYKSLEFYDRFYHDGSLILDVPCDTLRADWGAKYTIVSQVNPHVFPVLDLRCHGSPGQPIRGWGSTSVYRGGFLLALIEVALKEHLRFLLRVLALLDIAPSFNGINVGHVALQSYGGDLNIYPSRLYWTHLKVLNNVTYSEMEWFIHVGRHMIFPKIPLIKVRLDIEFALKSLTETLKKQLSNN